MTFEGPQLPQEPAKEKTLKEESLTTPELENEIRTLLQGLAEVRGLKVGGDGNKISISAELTHDLAGEFGVDGSLESDGQRLKAGDFKVRAGMVKRALVTRKLTKYLPDLIPGIVKYLEKKFNAPIKKISINAGILTVSLEKESVPVSPETVTPVSTQEEAVSEEVPTAVSVPETVNTAVIPEEEGDKFERIHKSFLQHFDETKIEPTVGETIVLPKEKREYLDSRRIGIENDETLSRKTKDEFLKLTDELEGIETDFRTKKLSSEELKEKRARKRHLLSILTTGVEVGITKEQIEGAHDAVKVIAEAPANLPIEEKPEKFPSVARLTQINEKFEKIFTGMRAEDLETVPGYSELTIGQKALVQENLQQIILGKIKEDAAAHGAEENKKAGFFGRFWRGITKGYQSAKLEKATAQDLQKAGIGEYRDVIEKLVTGTREVGLDAVFDKEGTLEVLYTNGIQAENEAEEETLRSFNTAAHVFTNIPTEWARETASRSERKKYEEAEKQFIQARANALLLLEAKNGSDRVTLAEQMNTIYARVRMDQLFSTHPEAEAQIQKITDEKVWVRSLKDIVTERGIYFGAGFATRAMTGALLGTLGLPLAAAGMGGFMARRRAQKTLKEQQAGARRGVDDTSTTAENIIHVDESKKKINHLIQRIENETDEAKKETLFSQLEERIYYTENKIYTSKMDFGTFNDRLKNQLDIVQAMSHASTFVASHEGVGDANHKAELEQRLDALTGLHEEKIKDSQKKFLRDQMVHGAIMGAGFSMAGYVLRHFAPDMFGWPKRAPEMFKSVSGNTELSENDIAMIPSRGTFHGIGPQDEIVYSKDAASTANIAEIIKSAHHADAVESGVFESAPHPELIDIERGGNIWNSAKELGERFHLDKKGFADAWSHSVAHLPDGREIPIAELNLVHEGDILQYVPAGNGEVAHFEFSNTSSINYSDVLHPDSTHGIEKIPSSGFEEGIVPNNVPEDVATEIPEDVVASDLAGSVEQGVNDTSTEYTETATLPEDTTGTIENLPFEEREGLGPLVSDNLSLEHLLSPEHIEHEMNRDMRAIFGTLKEEWSEWTQWKTMDARKVLEKMQFPDDTPAKKLQHYLMMLSRDSGLRPIGGIFRGEETTEAFIRRALAVVIQRENVG
ncbi:MAG: hypothetical protein NUW02_00610 [Candidatus Campbellbacteria bacterium]|nr:hypothetical protein [Candidatus Campbellbacteria bacterium]